MRFQLSGCVWFLALGLCATAMVSQASAQSGLPQGAAPPLRRPVMEAGYTNHDGGSMSALWQDGPPPVPAPGQDLIPMPGQGYPNPGVAGPPIRSYGEIGYGSYGQRTYAYPPVRIHSPGDGFYPYVGVAPDACCMYESACDDPTEYKLKVFTFCDIGHELWNELLFGVPDPTCRFDADCSQGPPVCCHKHGLGLLDFFPAHRDEVLARRAEASCGCSTSDALYHNANPHGGYGYGHDGRGSYGYGAYAAAGNYDRYAQQPNRNGLNVIEIGPAAQPTRQARDVFTVPTKLKIR